MNRKRQDDAFPVVDRVHSVFLGRLLESTTDVSKRLDGDLTAIREKYQPFKLISWDDLHLLTENTPSGTVVRHEKSVNPPFVQTSNHRLDEVQGAIEYRQAVRRLAKRYGLPSDVCIHLHTYLRDGVVWEATTYESGSSLNVAIMVVVSEAGDPVKIDWAKRNGRIYRILSAPSDQASSAQFAVNPIGDLSRVDEAIETVSKQLKHMLEPYWKKRPRRRDPSLAMLCAYFRDVVRMKPLDIWDKVLASVPAQWRGTPAERSRRRKVQEYVKVGRTYLGERQMSE